MRRRVSGLAQTPMASLLDRVGGDKKLAHALKGSVSIFDALEARDHSQKLQELGRAADFRGSVWVSEQLKEEIAESEENLRGYAGKKSTTASGATRKTKRRGSKTSRWA